VELVEILPDTQSCPRAVATELCSVPQRVDAAEVDGCFCVPRMAADARDVDAGGNARGRRCTCQGLGQSAVDQQGRIDPLRDVSHAFESLAYVPRHFCEPLRGRRGIRFD